MVDTVHGAISLCRAERLNRTNSCKTLKNIIEGICFENANRFFLL